MPQRLTITILGRTIGTASGWDGDPGQWVSYYDFMPYAGIDLPIGDLTVDDENGIVGLSNPETGEFFEPQDIVSLLQNIPRDKPIA